jgi:ABC-type multidrug transport system fused ATPase/permease subunit
MAFRVSEFKQYFLEFITFVGPRVRRLLLVDMVVGFFWFGIESLFVLILQGLLLSIGLVDKSITILPGWYPEDLNSNVIILIGFGALRCVALMMKNFCVVYSSQVFFYEKRAKILRGALKNDLKLSNNETISTFSELIGNAGNHVVHGTNLVHTTIVTFLFALLCFKIAPFETTIGTVLLAISIYPLRKISRKVSSYGQEMINSWNLSYSTLLNGLKNIFFLRLHEMTEHEIDKGVKSLKNYENQYKSYAISSSLTLGLPQFVGIIVLGSTATLGLHYFNTQPSILLAFFYLFVRLAQSASQMTNYISYFKLTSISFHKLKKIISDMEIENNKIIDKTKINTHQLCIEIKDLVIGYSHSQPLCKPLNAVLNLNTLYLVKGPSGSGKTTLLKTILGDISPIEGNVLYNTTEVGQIGNLSDFIGYVGPEPFLIYGSVRENIKYGLKLNDVLDSEIWNVLHRVGLKNAIDSFPGKLDEILLDETQLSSGQKQRLSFARALLRKPKFLILDEATANIDYETEAKIINIIQELKAQMIIFVISHKNSFDSLADEKLEFN